VAVKNLFVYENTLKNKYTDILILIFLLEVNVCCMVLHACFNIDFHYGGKLTYTSKEPMYMIELGFRALDIMLVYIYVCPSKLIIFSAFSCVVL